MGWIDEEFVANSIAEHFEDGQGSGWQQLSRQALPRTGDGARRSTTR